jgi:hypothetical protein
VEGHSALKLEQIHDRVVKTIQTKVDYAKGSIWLFSWSLSLLLILDTRVIIVEPLQLIDYSCTRPLIWIKCVLKGFHGSTLIQGHSSFESRVVDLKGIRSQ